jgi:hypothetical protein
MSSSEFIPLSREGIIRFQVVPETRMSVEIQQATWQLPALHLTLSGTCVALPDRTPVQVLARVAGTTDGPAFATTVPLAVPGYKPGSAAPTACKLAATIDLVACAALGRRTTLELVLTPNFPRTAKVPPLYQLVDLECRVDVARPALATIGAPVTLTPVVSDALTAAHLRLTIKEVDTGEEGAQTGKSKDGQPSTQLRWEGGLTAPEDQRQRTWRIGCASETDELEYPQPGEAGSYEFAFDLEVSFDGDTFHPVAAAPPQLTVPRPRLAAFTLAQPAPDQLAVRVQVDHLDPSFALPVNFELWKTGAKKAAVAKRLELRGGQLEQSFTDLKPLGLKPGDAVFALLSLAPDAAARPVKSASHWLEFSAAFATQGGRLAAWVHSDQLKLRAARQDKPAKATTPTRPAKKK